MKSNNEYQHVTFILVLPPGTEGRVPLDHPVATVPHLFIPGGVWASMVPAGYMNLGMIFFHYFDFLNF